MAALEITIIPEAVIKQAFEHFDADKSGTISLQELKSVLCRPTSAGIAFAEEEVQALLNKLDTNKDGNLNYAEFASGSRTGSLPGGTAFLQVFSAKMNAKEAREKVAAETAIQAIVDSLLSEYRSRAKELGIPDSVVDTVPPPSIPPTNPGSIRIFQCNILADGLADDGFLVQPILPELVIDYPALIDEVAAQRAAKGDMALLKSNHDSEASRKNHSATLDWGLRWARLRLFIAVSMPDIITFQEMDHMADAQRDLAPLGYECGYPGKKYEPAHKVFGTLKTDPQFKDAPRYLQELEKVGVAFAPKTQSNCRKFGLDTYLGEKADDDGVAIFWRRDAFALTKLDFIAIEDKKRNQGAVKVTLQRKKDGAPLIVIATHLSSGTKREDEEIRMNELTRKTYNAEGALENPSLVGLYEESVDKAPTLMCLDANSRPDQKEATTEGATVWKVLRSFPVRKDIMRSVWDSSFDEKGKTKQTDIPNTTNKMRGPLSDQPKKIGEHTYGVVDHIFFSPTLTMERHAWGPLTYASPDAALKHLLPTLEVPSDHAPVVADILMPSASE